MSFSIIAALDKKRGIGINNQLPWHLKADLKHFSQLTTQAAKGKYNAVVMGRKTWESLPSSFRPLPARLNVVLTKQEPVKLPRDVLNFPSLDKALKYLQSVENLEKIFVIGGGRVFEEAIKHPQCQELYITQIDKVFVCDVFFPPIPQEFKLSEESKVLKENSVSFRFLKYKRIE